MVLVGQKGPKHALLLSHYQHALLLSRYQVEVQLTVTSMFTMQSPGSIAFTGHKTEHFPVWELMQQNTALQYHAENHK